MCVTDLGFRFFDMTVISPLSIIFNSKKERIIVADKFQEVSCLDHHRQKFPRLLSKK
jgi:hypothetical protein